MARRYDYSPYERPDPGPRRSYLLPALLTIILLLLLLILYRVATRPEQGPSELSARRTSEPSARLSAPTADPSTPSTTIDPLAIRRLQDEPEAPEAGQFLPRWPATNSVETLNDAEALIRSLRGRPEGPEALRGVTVILDPGHGGIDGGTVYPSDPPHDIVEKEVVLKLGERTRSALEALGAEVVMTRDRDEWFSVYHRAAQAGRLALQRGRAALEGSERTLDWFNELETQMQLVFSLNKDKGGGAIIGGYGTARQARELYDLQRQFPEVIFLSLHCNFIQGYPDVAGLQVYYLTNDSYYAYEQQQVGAPDPKIEGVYQNFNDEGREKLARTVAHVLTNDVPETQTVGGPQTLLRDRGFVVLKNVGFDSVLVEVGYLSNAEDRARLASDDYLQRLARALARSVYVYYCE